jgi:hypothetical protein
MTTAPLTPPDCNLQDFAFMPLDVARLRDSDMAAYESPEACWAAVLLWSAAWHQVPAASLPDDDRFLAKAAGYGRVVKEWANVREGALHGWIKCADGRLYHPVVAEKALESWKAKLHHQWKKECDRIRKANKQREAEGRPLLPLPPEPGTTSDILPEEPKEIPLESAGDSAGNPETAVGNPTENALKGEGEGQGEGQGQGELKTSLSAQPSTTAPDDDREHPSQKPKLERHTQIAMLLRAQGIAADGMHPTVACTWAQNERVTDLVLNAAIVKAKATLERQGRGGDVSIAYLEPIVVQILAAPPTPPHAAHPGRPEKFDPVAHVNRNRITS